MESMWQKGERIAERFTVVDVVPAGPTSYLVSAESDDGSPVFIRAVRMGGLSDWNAVQSAEERSKIYGQLRHSSLPAFVGYFTEELEGDAAFYLVYERTSSPTVEEAVAVNGPFSQGETRTMIADICEGLHLLHTCEPEILHGHISPSAIVKNDGSFGLLHLPMTKRIEELMPASRPSLIDEAYVPLEQKKGKQAPVSDLYSLGMTAIFSLTGKHPHLLPTKHFKPQFHSTTRSTAIDTAIDRMVEPNAADRVSSTRRVLDLIGNTESSRPGGLTGQTHEVAPTNVGTDVEIKSRESGDSIFVRNPSANKTESILVGFLLDQWVSKPWLIIIIAAALTAGPVALPLIIFLFYPKSRALINRAYARFRDVKVSVDENGISVSDQLTAISKEDIQDIDCRERATGSGIQFRPSRN